MAQKRVDVVAPCVKTLNGEDVLFSQILKDIDGKKKANAYKDHQLKLLTTEKVNCNVGLIITGQLKNLPPKKNKVSGVLSPLDIDTNKENLSFGNICIYDDSINVMFYEVNQNGCYLDDFANYLQTKWNETYDDNKIEVSFSAVSRKGEYSRFVKMSYYKEVYVEFSNPNEIIEAHKDDKSSTWAHAKKYISAADKSNSDKLIIHFSTFGKKINKAGLSRKTTKTFIDAVRYLLTGSQKKNVEKLKIKGYFTDPDSPKALQPINLVADTFNIYIKLADKIKQEDLQELDRKTEIEKLYDKHLSELKDIFKK